MNRPSPAVQAVEGLRKSLKAIHKENFLQYDIAKFDELRRAELAAVADMLEQAGKDIIGEDFVEVTQYDRAINGVKSMQRQALQALIAALREPAP